MTVSPLPGFPGDPGKSMVILTEAHYVSLLYRIFRAQTERGHVVLHAETSESGVSQNYTRKTCAA